MKMPDIDRQIHEKFKGKFVYFGCLECGKKSLLGNLAQRMRDGTMPKCHGKNMLLVKTEDKAVQAALKSKRGEKLTPEEIDILVALLRGAESKPQETQDER